MTMSYKAWMRTGRDDWNTNALVFATEKEAEDYAKDLSSRWTLVEQYEVRKSDDEVNYEFIDEQLNIIDIVVPLTLHLVRGLPGTGKTTVAHKLCNTVFSADDFFDALAEQLGKRYTDVFDPIYLTDAHSQCQKNTKQAMIEGRNVAVANTFVEKWEAEPYFAMASEHGYTVCVVHCQSQFGSVHDVPKESIEEMRKRWEDNIHHNNT
jgi:predicted kinase